MSQPDGQIKPSLPKSEKDMPIWLAVKLARWPRHPDALVKRPGLSVTALAQAVGMKPQAVSNQLQRLVDKGILRNDRNGTSIHYRIVDPCIMSLLDRGLCLTEDALERRSRTSRRRTLATA